MEPTQIGFVVLSVIVILMSARLPVTVVIAGAGVLGAFLVHAFAGAGHTLADALRQTEHSLSSGLADLFSGPAIWLLPLFISLGNIAFYAGISTRIHDAALIWLRRFPGGAAIASVIGCGGFAALSGSSVACATTMGRICLPEMRRLGYDPRLAAASVAVGGTLGALIPPSVLFILFGIFAGAPINLLFLAGILPGLLSLAGMVLAIILWVSKEPAAAPAARPDDRGEGTSLAQAAMAIWPAVMVFAILVAGLLSGLASLTQAGLACVILALMVGFAQHRLDLAKLRHALVETLRQTAALFLAVAAAKLFFEFVALTGLDAVLVGLVQSAGFSLLGTVAMIVLAYLLLGLVLEPIGILLLTLPFILPLAQAQGMDLIWFGVIIVKLLEIALITPPFGLNVFILSSVSRGISPATIFAGVGHFLLADLLVLLVLILFPVISTLIPSAM